MLNNYKTGLMLLAAGIISTMVGCQKEEEPLDLEAPTLELEISGNPAKLYNETTLRSTASDNDTISRVVFYVNSDSIGQVTAAPYEINWNTKEVEDGRHMLKATAYDASGNKTEAAKEVTIKNTLFVMHVGDEYFQPREDEKQDQWIFLSDKDGNVIGEAKQLANGQTLRWERPADFYEETVYLNRLYYDSWNSSWSQKTYDYVSLYTYPDFTIEESSLSGYSRPDSIGKVDVTVENNFGGTDYFYYQTRFPYFSRGNSTTGNQATYSVNMEQNSQKGFSAYEKSVDRSDQHLREKFYRMDELEAGKAYTFHTDEYTPMEEQTINVPSNFSYVRISTYGYLNEEQERGYSLDYTSIWNNQSTEIKTFYTDAFPLLRTSLSAEEGNKYYYTSRMGRAPETISMPDFSLTLQSEKLKNVEVSSSQGSFDVGRGSWRYTEESETQYLRATRAIYVKSEAGAQYVLPETPASLLELYPALSQPMEYAGVWVMDYQSLESYDEILKYWFTDTYNRNDHLNYTSLYIDPENTGGRVLPTRTDSAQEEMEKEDLRARGIFMH